jgi:methylated-DNA-[protein]-cysteine S-methyltransferase
MSTHTPTDHQIIADLADAVPAPTAGEVDVLHALLTERADAQGLLDLTYRTVDSPYGSFLVVASPEGLVRVAFELEGHDAVLEAVASAVSPRILHSGRRTDEAARQLDEYFGGQRRAFDLPVDLRLVRGFRHSVISHLREIPYGTTETYAIVAKAAGNAGAVRAAGSACAHNPIPVVIPCHRVVRSDGSIGQYLGGTDTKAALLAMESAA